MFRSILGNLGLISQSDWTDFGGFYKTDAVDQPCITSKSADCDQQRKREKRGKERQKWRRFLQTILKAPA